MGRGGSPGRSSFVAYWAPVLFYLGLILTVSSIPGPRLEPLRLASWDKLAHAIEYAGLSLLLARALAAAGPWRGTPSPLKVTLVALVAAIAWGAIDENFQRLTGRQPDIFDFLADSVGVILAQAARFAARASRPASSRGQDSRRQERKS